jgi:hypothetical protein
MQQVLRTGAVAHSTTRIEIADGVRAATERNGPIVSLATPPTTDKPFRTTGLPAPSRSRYLGISFDERRQDAYEVQDTTPTIPRIMTPRRAAIAIFKDLLRLLDIGNAVPAWFNRRREKWVAPSRIRCSADWRNSNLGSLSRLF